MDTNTTTKQKKPTQRANTGQAKGLCNVHRSTTKMAGNPLYYTDGSHTHQLHKEAARATKNNVWIGIQTALLCALIVTKRQRRGVLWIGRSEPVPVQRTRPKRWPKDGANRVQSGLLRHSGPRHSRNLNLLAQLGQHARDCYPEQLGIWHRKKRRIAVAVDKSLEPDNSGIIQCKNNMRPALNAHIFTINRDVAKHLSHPLRYVFNSCLRSAFEGWGRFSPQSRLHSVRNAGWQNFRPFGYRGWRNAHCSGQ